QPAFTMTKSDGTFSLSLADYGSYEIGVSKDGLPPVMKNIELRANNAATVDGNATADVYYKGKVITLAVPLVISLKKGAYTISGKVLDSNSNGIGYAPIFATDANGNSANSGTSSDGSYTIFVDAGTWTVKSMMPPDKTDGCGTFEKTVVVSTESKSSQNITPSTSTCYTLSGTVTLTGVSTLNNVPVSISEWDTTNSRPVMGGMFKGTSTNSSGVYSIKVAGAASPGKTYRISIWDPTYGELSTTAAVIAADITNAHITSGTTHVATLAFTGGSASHEAFIELKKADDSFTRIGKTQKGLASNAAFTMKAGSYNYSVDVFGVGKYNGVVDITNGDATATIDLSTTTLVTLSGNVKDNAGTPASVSGALITVKASDGTMKTATTDSSGNYSMSVKAGTYTVSASKSQYLAGQAAESVTLAANTANYDFSGDGTGAGVDQAALKKSDQVISGTIYQSGGSTPATTAFVTATDSTTGVSVSAPVDSVTGAYTLPVDDGAWTVKAVAPLHAKTTKSGAVTVTGTTDSTGSTNNITLTGDATKSSSSASSSISAASGGSINDTQNTGMKLTAGQGVLETGSATITVDVEKTFTAPDTDSFTPLASAAFDIEAQNAESTSSIKDLKGNAEIQIDYSSLVNSLPSGVSEANLKLAYYSTEKDAYVPVEGGFTVDTVNNVITGQVNHFTSFSIIYSPLSISSTSGGVDITPPAAPTNFNVTSSSGKATLTWTDPTDYDFSTIEILRNSGEGTSVSNIAYSTASKGAQTYADTSATAGATYKYQLRALDTTGNNSLSAEKSVQIAAAVAQAPGGGASTPATTPAVTTPAATTTTTTTTAPAATAVTVALPSTAAPVAVLIKDPTKLDEILSQLNLTSKPSEVAKYMPLIKSDAIAFKVGLSDEQQTAITNFVAYGISEKTVALGAGERRAVMRDYLETVGKSDVNWEDVERITKGEKPIGRNLAKEQAKVSTVLKAFAKITGHKPNFKDADEDLAWNTMMYRIRFTRDLTKEAQGIKEFKAIFKRVPSSPIDWSSVRALGYVLE
ncbi:MAG: carboxypeptidase regulatory-like domain-containing protein, partial [Parcubacteria group bacterium]